MALEVGRINGGTSDPMVVGGTVWVVSPSAMVTAAVVVVAADTAGLGINVGMEEADDAAAARDESVA